MIQAQLPSYAYSFNPNDFCIKPHGKWGNCLACPLEKNSEVTTNLTCSPCNSCPRREGFWTPSKTEENKLVEVKCHEPCRILAHWQSATKYKICLLKDRVTSEELQEAKRIVASLCENKSSESVKSTKA